MATTGTEMENQLDLFNSSAAKIEAEFYPPGISAVRVRDWLVRFYGLERIRGREADAAWMSATADAAVSIPVNA